MKIIAHRGNTTGKKPDKENTVDYISKALELGYDVETDVWLLEGNLFLGHDRPIDRVETSLLKRNGVWCHAKNIPALKVLLDMGAHCFYHESDKATLTSKGYIWTYPGEQLVPGSVCVMPEKGFTGDIYECYAVCTDDILKIEGID